MTVVRALLPLAIVVAALGALAWFLLTSDSVFGPWLLAALVFAHGWVHLMFVFPKPDPATATTAAGGLAYPFDWQRSWLITRASLGDGLVRAAGSVLMLVTLGAAILAALATVAILVPTDWWSGLIIITATSSLLLLAMAFSPLLLLGIAIDLALLWLVIGSVWSPGT